MLDADIKRKIDNARDILVGVLPSPEGQVRQITFALVYKFMDDMDKQAIELGGERTFFSGDFEKYSWSNLISPKISGEERLKRYSEAIEQMDHNKNIPQLFRDIFKDAFLPYRNVSTLNMFLKQINEFNYDNSENLGTAFEYLLSVMGSQGDAGQFRTPRHIIDFIVEVVDPKKTDRILDPACGSAGFLISAYKHIVKENKDKNGASSLSPEDKKRLGDNIHGYDISSDMVRLGLVNMYLHSFKSPNIVEYDTLSSERKWKEKFDVILTNPPFMTPKGGIVPHDKYEIKSNRAEALFVEYIMEHLTKNGRAGVIVPEGVIFKGDNAFKNLRKKMFEKDYLWAVVSLPAGVFRPYAGVKTSVLLFDREITKKSDEILFVKVENDGFDLGAQRRSIPGGELEVIASYINEYKNIILGIPKRNKGLSSLEILLKTGHKKHYEPPYSLRNFLVVKKSKIMESSDYNLTGERYRENEIYKNQKWPMVELGEVLDYEQPTKYIVESVNYDDSYKTPVLTAGKTFILGYTNEKEGIFSTNNLPVIIFDDFTTAIKFVDFPFKVKSSAMKILHVKKGKADVRFLFEMMRKIKFRHEEHKRYWISEYSKIKIPLPTIKVQKEIVEQIEVKQNAINAAREVIKNLERERRYFGKAIEKLEGVEWVELGKIGKICMCKRIFKDQTTAKGDVPFYKIGTFGQKPDSYISQKIYDEYTSKYPLPKKGDILISTSGTIGRTVVYDGKPAYFQDSNIVWINNNEKLVINEYLHYIFQSIRWTTTKGGTIERLYNKLIEKTKILIPPLEVQKQLIAEAEREEEIISTNKRLIKLMKEKINKVLMQI